MRRRLLLPALGVAPLAGAQAPLRVVLPRSELGQQHADSERLLRLALQRSGVAHEVHHLTELLSYEGTRRALHEGQVSVVDWGYSLEAEQRFPPVYFPIDLGLSAYRRLVVRQEQAAEIGALRTLDGLRRYRIGQGHGWSDVGVLQTAGLQVATGEFQNLFRMLRAGRFDLLPLGLAEAADLLQRLAGQASGCVMLRRPLLHYPFARMFFVSPRQPALREALQAGLERAMADGSLPRLARRLASFAPLHGGTGLAAPQGAGLDAVIRIDNPFLSGRFRAMPASWFATPRQL